MEFIYILGLILLFGFLALILSNLFLIIVSKFTTLNEFLVAMCFLAGTIISSVIFINLSSFKKEVYVDTKNNQVIIKITKEILFYKDTKEEKLKIKEYIK